MSTHGAELMYTYAVARAGCRPPDGLLGVAGAPVETVTEGALAALVSRVPAADFDEEALRAHLEDMAWLERTARAHRSVVDTAAAEFCVLPLRLVTVHRDARGVRQVLAQRAEEFLSALVSLDGRMEWGVKAYVEDPGTAKPPVPATGSARQAPADGSGRDFLRRRLAHRQAQEQSQRRADELAGAAHEALDKFAERSRLHRPQDPRLSGVSGRNVLNGAYLIPRDQAGAFAGLVGELADRSPGVRIELTGPWAPYSFTQAPQPPEAGGETGPGGAV
ncbi:GvpL/GvpF family gas vesicle protein [Streptomyces rimosus]|uniref:GvpL/GvpF family gas vesicle protein n=1 Tax=Streptomyces rimosus TaxID=1927 RepID=UPI000A91C6E2|nr:GvpL/GvpF family gas vesicle protein [Streptomyces rimosus]